MEDHEVCQIFPMMGDEEYNALEQDIAKHGLRESLWTYQEKLIDGRNRLRACQALGIEPKYREWDGKGSLVDFVVSLNLHRRHLTPDQRAACAQEALPYIEAEARKRKIEGGSRGGKATRRKSTPSDNGKHEANVPHASDGRTTPAEKTRAPQSRDLAAEAFGVKGRRVQDAKAVATVAPELIAKVKTGSMTLSQARQEVRRREKRAELKVKAEAIKANDDSDTASWSIIRGDCVEILARMELGSARLIFVDPPYNLGFDYGDGPAADRLPTDKFLGWTRSWIEAAVRLLTADGSMWVLINHEWAARVELMLGDAGLHMRCWLTWYESFGVNCARGFNRCSRRLLYAVKDPKSFVFYGDAVTRPSDRQAKYGDSRADPGGKLWDDVWGINPPIPRLTGTAKERIPDFPTQLPLALLLPIVGCASEPGDLVVDPFNGSGTTGEAALRLGRRYIGIEKSENFCDLSHKRLTITQGEIVSCSDMRKNSRR